ncbi:DNA-binding response regulator [Alteromonas sp. KC3]|uniref:response regulator transcription factor n=1 Tax=unclassified Alteromonas TaxID=2614992 RepID=UPI0019211DAB|nr:MULTISPECIES: response regulator transcription factor [unclassified Alteromonas]BCO17908.1 DNA-binding response regulator [Alteromonas sp. KC3]BCO21869.1 DNA-binding response regulator [Alteromonas sp. KC14]
MKVLIIEDDIDIANLVSIQVEELQGKETIVNTLSEAFKKVSEEEFNIIVLDLSLPDGDGIEFCKEFRKSNETTPILMLSARRGELDRVVGLEVGADDYLSKPFSLAELKARIKALLRRAMRVGNIPENSEIRIGSLRMIPHSHQAFVRGNELSLTAKEFSILMTFASNPTHVFSRSDLLNRVWGVQHEGYEHTVNSHLNRLRQKLEDDAKNPQIIQTVWGVGYKLNPDAL